MNTGTSLHNHRLSRNALRLGAIVGNTLANIAPAMSMFLASLLLLVPRGLARRSRLRWQP